MPNDARNSYLENQVLTATPQKLRLMVIDGAIRFSKLALDQWENVDKRNEALVRSRALVSELLGSIKPDGSDAANNTARVNIFIYESLVDGQLQESKELIEGAIEVLEVERGTWALVCEELTEAPKSDEEKAREITASNHAAITPPASQFGKSAVRAPSSSATPRSGSQFSFDA